MIYIRLKYLINIFLFTFFFILFNSCENDRREQVSLNIEKIKLDSDFRINKIILPIMNWVFYAEVIKIIVVIFIKQLMGEKPGN